MKICSSSHLRGLVEPVALLPRRHTPWQREMNSPFTDHQLGHICDLNEDGRSRRQVAHADGEHVLQREESMMLHRVQPETTLQWKTAGDVQEHPGPSSTLHGLFLPPVCTPYEPSLSPSPEFQKVCHDHQYQERKGRTIRHQ